MNPERYTLLGCNSHWQLLSIFGHKLPHPFHPVALREHYAVLRTVLRARGCGEGGLDSPQGYGLDMPGWGVGGTEEIRGRPDESGRLPETPAGCMCGAESLPSARRSMGGKRDL